MENRNFLNAEMFTRFFLGQCERYNSRRVKIAEMIRRLIEQGRKYVLIT